MKHNWRDFNTAKTIRPFILMALFAAVYIMAGLYYMGQHPYFSETDSVHFINYAQGIQAQGSLRGFVRSLFTGSFTMSNQHPLFPVVMSFFEMKDISFFINTKIVNMVIGLVFIVIIFWILIKESDEGTALLTVALFIANDVFMHQTTMISCEPMLMVFSLLSFYFIIKGVDDNRYWAVAGVFCGLAYMTKASGLFILFGFFLYLMYDVKLRFWKLLKNKYLWMFLGCFVLVSLPLLVRNTIVYNFPIYNFNVEMLAWEENWGRTEQVPGFYDLFRHNILYYPQRFFRGIFRELRILVYSLYSFSIHYVPRFQHDAASPVQMAGAVIVSVALFITALAGFYRSQLERRKKYLIVFLVTGFFLPLSWYSITSPNRRYIMVVLPFLLFFSSSFIIDRLDILKSFVLKRISLPGIIKENFPVAVVSALLIISAIVIPATTTIPCPSETYGFENDYDAIALYLEKNLGDKEFILTRGFHHYSWKIFYPDLDRKRISFSYFNTYDRFYSYLEQNPGISYILVQPEMYRATKHYITPYISYTPENGFEFHKPFAGWELVMMDTAVPANYVLLRRK